MSLFHPKTFLICPLKTRKLSAVKRYFWKHSFISMMKHHRLVERP